MSTHNIGFYEYLTKLSLNYHQISSNMHLISSADIRYGTYHGYKVIGFDGQFVFVRLILFAFMLLCVT